MNASKSLLERVDSLMQRKRKFVAGAPEASENGAVSTDDEDLPVLTEVVDISEVSSDAPNHAIHAPPDPRLDALGREFSQRLQQRLADELPRLIDESSARLAADVRHSVQRIADEVLREFVAGRRAQAASAAPQTPDLTK